MDRRDFISMAGCSFASLLAASTATESAAENLEQTPTPPPPKRAKYKLEIEIYEARPDTWCHKKGDKFAYPADIGKICPWLLSSMHDALILLDRGVILPWKYEKTPYEKVIDADGVTTEFIRCPDPTANLVAKITRTKIG